MEQIPFVSSAPNTLGIELELQLIDPTSYDLTAASDELLAQMANHPSPTASNRKSRGP